MRVTGSLQEKNGIFQMVVRIPDARGIQKQKFKSTHIKAHGKNQRESRSNRIQADRMLAEWITELSKAVTYGGDRDLIAAIEEWIEQKKRHLRIDTAESYLCNYRVHIEPYFKKKKLRLSDVTPRIIQQYVNKKEDEGQSAKSIRKHLVILNGVFKEAVAFGEISSNPCANIHVKVASDKRFKGTAYEPQTAKQLLVAVKGDPIEPAVYLGLYLGLRRSEVVGLRWKDVDFQKGVVYIRNTIVRFSTLSEGEQTKSRASRRDLYLPAGLRWYLEELRRSQISLAKLCRREYNESQNICQWPDGSTYDPDYVSRRFRKVLKKNNLPIIRFHDLRHTAGSILVNTGHSIKQVQEFLGHEKASTTLDIYSHVSVESKRDTADKLDALLSREC